MTTQLTSDQESIVQSAIAQGLAPSAEAFISQALQEKHEQAELNRWLHEVAAPRIDARGEDRSELKNSTDSLAEILNDQ